MAENATVFQTGGGGTNFEQFIQSSFLVGLIIKGNAPTIPPNEIVEVVLQSSRRGWATDDLLVIAKSALYEHKLFIQAKHNIVFSADNSIFNDVITSFWKDFNNPDFNKENDRLVIAKSRLNNVERNHIKALISYAKTHNTTKDFLAQTNRFELKKEKLAIFRLVLQNANKGILPSEEDIWKFLKVIDILGYDFLDEGSVDETYFLNLIKLSKSSEASISENDIWNSIITLVAKSNPSGASFDASSSQLKALHHYFNISKTQRVFKAVEKLKQDSNAILIPLKSGIGPDSKPFHIDRNVLKEQITAATFSHQLTIITGKPGVGKSVAVKENLTTPGYNTTSLVFRADQFNQPHLSNVMSAMGIQGSLNDIFACLALVPDKIIFIDSMEKLLENADPDSAFKQLLTLCKKNNIRIVCTSRTYAVDLLIQKFGVDHTDLKIIEVPLLNDNELNNAVTRFPALSSPLKNPNIKSLLRSPKYLDFTLKAIISNPQDFSNSSIIEFKEKLWSTLVCNAIHRSGGLPAKREKAFMEIAVNRAREMALFAKISEGDPEAIDLLENDDIIFQDGSKRKYAPSHDILEDWALTRYVASCFDDNPPIKDFFSALGNEPAIRRAFRLWVDAQLMEDTNNIASLVKASLSDSTIETYWADELLIAIFKSDHSAPFFKMLESSLLEDKGTLLNRCMHIIKTACRETNYNVSETPLLMPVGSGWEQMLIFLDRHISGLNHLRSSILQFLNEWDYRLIFDYPAHKPELEAAKKIVLFFIDQAQKKNKFWDHRSNASNKRLLINILLNLALISKDEITDLVHRAMRKKGRNSSWHSDEILDLLLKNICYGPVKHQMAYALPDLILEAVIKEWKWVAPKPRKPIGDMEEMMFTASLNSIRKEHAWGVNSTFGFSPPGIFKTPLYNIAIFHPLKAVTFIVTFINYSVTHYVKSDFNYKHSVSEVEITLSDKTKIKQWAGWELWVAYRGLSVTDYLLESLLMALEKILFDLAQNESEKGQDIFKKCFEFVLKNSTNVMTTGVLASVTMAHPQAIGDAFLPLVTIKEIYHWDFQRVWKESGTFALYDEQIPSAQKIRYDSNQLPHRTRYPEGFGGFLIDYQFNIKTFNEKLYEIFDKMWAALSPDDVVWKKKLHEIDSRKWVITDVKPELGEFQIQPGYDDEVKALVETGKPEIEAVNTAATYSQEIKKVFEGKEKMNYDKWNEYFAYYGSKQEFNTHFDKPITFAAVGLKNFGQQLNDDQRQWCLSHLMETIGYILGGLRNYDFERPPLYNYMEQDTALQSLHLLFTAVSDTEDINELIFLSGFVLAAPFHDPDREKLNQYFRTEFATALPDIHFRIWSMFIHLARFKKENPYFYDDHDRKRLENAREKEFKFIEQLCKAENVEKFNVGEITFENSEAYFLLNALLVIPTTFERDEHKQYLLRFLELLTVDLPKDSDHGFGPRRSGKQLQHQSIFDIEKHLAQTLLHTDITFAKQLLEKLIPISKATSESHYHHNDPVEFILRTFDHVIYAVDSLLQSGENVETKNTLSERFWLLWDYMTDSISLDEMPYFARTLLLDTTYSWSMDNRDFILLRGRSEKYKEVMNQIGPRSIPSAIKIFSTIGSKEFMPASLSWIVALLKKDIKQIEEINITNLNQFIKLLYSEHISTIKKNQELVAEFIWLLDKLIGIGNSTAYLYRENVIVYKNTK